MVVIHLKRTEVDQFLFVTTVKESNDALIRKLVASATEELSKYGPSRPPEERGLDEKTVEMSRRVEAETRAIGDSGEGGAAAAGGGGSEGKKVSLPDGSVPCEDPTHYRVGMAPPPELAATLQKVAEDAKSVVSKEQVKRKAALSEELLAEKKALIDGAVKMAYPMGLPPHDPVRMMLEGADELIGAELFDEDTATLWWAGKEFLRDQTVGDRVGRNEKTKIVARLQTKGGGPPVREPAVTEEERKAMMAFYFKKQAEAKELAEDDEDSYLKHSWADPGALKDSLRGTAAVRFK